MTKLTNCAALLLASSLCLTASGFRTGQAARAVIGQSSFSAHDSGIVARALSVSNGTLYVADTSDHLLAFKLSHLAASKNAACAVCFLSPDGITNQGVIPGIASSAVYGSIVVVADSDSRRVLIWRGAIAKPAVVLEMGDPVSVAFDGQRLFVGDALKHKVFVWESLPTSDGQAPDAVLGQPDTSSESTAADTIQNPVALASDGANLYVADADARRVLVYSPGDKPLSGKQIVNAASLMPGPLAPGMLVSIEYPAASETPHVLLDGIELPVLEANSDAIQTQLPYLLNSSASSLVVRAEHADGTSSYSDAVGVSFVPAAPGIYAFSGKEPRSGLLLHQGQPLTSDSPAKVGDTLTVWATGLGLVDPASENREVQIPVRAYINGQPALVVSAELPQSATGVYEVHVQLPQGVTPGQVATLVLSQNEFKSNAVVFPVGSEN
jgi:uncharacterized protein (TIGR03437 family)